MTFCFDTENGKPQFPTPPGTATLAGRDGGDTAAGDRCSHPGGTQDHTHPDGTAGLRAFLDRLDGMDAESQMDTIANAILECGGNWNYGQFSIDLFGITAQAKLGETPFTIWRHLARTRVGGYLQSPIETVTDPAAISWADWVLRQGPIPNSLAMQASAILRLRSSDPIHHTMAKGILTAMKRAGT